MMQPILNRVFRFDICIPITLGCDETGRLIWLMKMDQEGKWNKEWEKEEEEKKREREELDKCKEERLKRKTHDKGAASRSTSGAASKKKVSPNN